MRISTIVLSLSVMAVMSGCAVDSPIRTSSLWPTGYHGQHRYDHTYNEDFTNPDAPLVVEQTQATPPMTMAVIEDTSRQMTVMPQSSGYGDLLHESYFRHGSAQLSASDKKALKAVAEDVKVTDSDITVVGHASNRVDGHASAERKSELNHNISNKRAIAVTRELTSQGVSPSKINAVAQGDAIPNAHPGDKTQEEADRRVEIYAETPTVVTTTVTEQIVEQPAVVFSEGPLVTEEPAVVVDTGVFKPAKSEKAEQKKPLAITPYVNP